jgi:catechol 2,3-dioxygenase-like lactoylglutathione lyase family enzyme
MVFYSTVLFVKDIEVSKKFYILFLNFSIEHDFGKNVIMNNGLTLWEISPEHIINKQLKTANESNRFELYFETDNLEEISHKLKTAGVKFLHPIKEESWGQRTVRFFDPDYHLVEIGEPMDVFINNMHKNGLTPAQISSKSGIPIEKVVGLIWK